jgi:hypothetical protein
VWVRLQMRRPVPSKTTRISGPDINAGDQTTWCFFTMACSKVTGGVITGGDGADGGGSTKVDGVGEVVGEAGGEDALLQ